MKRKGSFLLLLSVYLASCGHNNKFTHLSGYPDFNGLNRYEDKNVTCYLFLKDEYPALWCAKK